jgi:hypothetical protein
MHERCSCVHHFLITPSIPGVCVAVVMLMRASLPHHSLHPRCLRRCPVFSSSSLSPSPVSVSLSCVLVLITPSILGVCVAVVCSRGPLDTTHRVVIGVTGVLQHGRCAAACVPCVMLSRTGRVHHIQLDQKASENEALKQHVSPSPRPPAHLRLKHTSLAALLCAPLM